MKVAFQGVELLDVFYRPHGKDEGCTCIKPEIGMIKQAIHKYPENNLEKSFMIGGSADDSESSINIRVKGFGIGVGSNYKAEKIYQLNTIKHLTLSI